jgi:hypothetical protein
MNARSAGHAAEIAALKRWHEHAPASRVLVCPLCRAPRTFLKSQWSVGRYSCERCGANVDDLTWRR